MSSPSTAPAPLAGLHVAAFEARMAGPMADLIAKHGGVPIEAPALREIPIGQNSEALTFAGRLIAGEFDAVIFLTGVGSRYLLQEIEAHYPRAAFLAALENVKTVVRGPKPLAVLREWKVHVDVQVPEPNTWREILAALDARLPVAGLRVAVQEYGKPSPELLQGLRDRGAEVTAVPVYRWALPEDTGPLRRAIRALADRQIDAALFTSAQQVVHLMQVASEEGLETELRAAFHDHVIVGSVGPTTHEALREHGLPVDIEPEHPKMGHLVAALARDWPKIGKGRIEALGKDDAQDGAVDLLHDSLFLKACRREPTERTPIWLMRQAGRYMPEYRALRAKVGFLDLCRRPELAAEVTVTAAERLGVDAAILFADILLILEPLGFLLEFAKGEGPVIHNPVREAADVDRVRPLADPAPLDYVFQAVRLIRSSLRPDLPLIGFAGAPFTLACYAIEGGASRHYERAKAFMYRDPGAWDALMERLVEATQLYLNAQVAAGAQALQVFDSWVGTLSPDDYRRFVQPHMRRLFAGLAPSVPTIHFGTDTASLLELQRDAGGQVIGLDWRVELDRAWERLGPGVAVQGNLDPAVLLAPISELTRQARRLLDRAGGRPGHIFNLGHGILPQTPVDHVRALIDVIHSTPRDASSSISQPV
ncbi:MAG: uroporphyrinogen decarboxylase [Isosphaeraceae bacterium]|nr:uroporphyrinogen decarboxylase [Isosphaeraceae bacterium]